VPVAITLAANGRRLYVVNSDAGSYDGGTGSISQYAVAWNGALTPDTPALIHTSSSIYSGAAVPNGLAVSPTGRAAVVTTGDGTVLQYALAANGTLSPDPATVTIPTFPLDAGPPIGAAFNANGSSFYATNFGGGFVAGSGEPVGSDGPAVVSPYEVTPRGTLSPMTPSEVLLGAPFVSEALPIEIVLNNPSHGLGFGLG
jgi:DNA-binding beta-propeller fold protein YncE